MRAMSPEQIFDSVSMVTNPKDKPQDVPNQQFFNPNLPQTLRQQFMNKFQTQDRRHEPQTSILQVLFMMNGKLLADKTKAGNNEALATLSTQHPYRTAVQGEIGDAASASGRGRRPRRSCTPHQIVVPHRAVARSVPQRIPAARAVSGTRRRDRQPERRHFRRLLGDVE